MAIRSQFQMTLSDWLHPAELVERIELQTDSRDRKHRLYVCACLEHILHLLTDRPGVQAIRVAEQFADGARTLEALEQAHADSSAARKLLAIQGEAARLTPLTHDRNRALETARHAAKAVWLATLPEPLGRGVAMVVADHVRLARAWAGDPLDANLNDLYEDLASPSLTTLDPAWLHWRDATIPRLAQQIYDTRDFASMPILADALEEAGCTDGNILDHCRGAGPHARGCWVVDLVLGQE